MAPRRVQAPVAAATSTSVSAAAVVTVPDVNPIQTANPFATHAYFNPFK
ncbi:MAG: hypothetical protein KGH68_02590 [Patescibacteria group bacterium]|nr:hypothetical protein [Patescibacteria group bacterium]